MKKKKFNLLCFLQLHDYEPYDRYEKELYRTGDLLDGFAKYKVYEKCKCANCGHKKDVLISTNSTEWTW